MQLRPLSCDAFYLLSADAFPPLSYTSRREEEEKPASTSSKKKETAKTSRGPDVMSNFNLFVTEQTCSTSLLKKKKKKTLEPNKL